MSRDQGTVEQGFGMRGSGEDEMFMLCQLPGTAWRRRRHINDNNLSSSCLSKEHYYQRVAVTQLELCFGVISNRLKLNATHFGLDESHLGVLCGFTSDD